MASIPEKPLPRCGIYLILNIKTGDCYVGQAVGVANRWKVHRQALRAGNHHTKRLQASFTEHGEKAFRFRVIEDCSPGDLDAREFAWMVRLRPSLNTVIPDYRAIARLGELAGKPLRVRDGSDPADNLPGDLARLLRRQRKSQTRPLPVSGRAKSRVDYFAPTISERERRARLLAMGKVMVQQGKLAAWKKIIADD